MPYVNIVSASLMTILLSMTYVTAAATVSSRTLDAVSDTTIPLPAGKYATLRLLGSAVNGKQPHQNFVVTYTDGTTNTITQSLSDWWGPPQNYTGESQVLKMPYLVTVTGATMNRVVYVYGYSFAINSSKTIKSLTLPHNRNVRVLAIDVSARGATPVRVNLAAVDNVGGIVNNGTAPIDGGWDNCCHAYSANLLEPRLPAKASRSRWTGPGQRQRRLRRRCRFRARRRQRRRSDSSTVSIQPSWRRPVLR